ncbi:hypothetical protein LZ30DRAFT_471166 [Colletotrichum cereale]|nr:hypothetical protein LZ30DRAFT_471166 [Colletotrichum cereale]
MIRGGHVETGADRKEPIRGTKPIRAPWAFLDLALSARPAQGLTIERCGSCCGCGGIRLRAACTGKRYRILRGEAFHDASADRLADNTTWPKRFRSLLPWFLSHARVPAIKRSPVRRQGCQRLHRLCAVLESGHEAVKRGWGGCFQGCVTRMAGRSGIGLDKVPMAVGDRRCRR